MSGDIFLNIERIVLHGLEHINRHELETALRKALLEQLASGSIGQSLVTKQVRTDIALPGSCNAGQLGQSLADKLCNVISTPGANTPPRNTGKQRGQHDA
jgi:hypothetical protein